MTLNTVNSNKDTIYVFDFDDTLIHSTNTVYIFENVNGEERLVHSLTPTEYYEYEVQPNQRIDYSEFDSDTMPRDIKINNQVVRIMKDAIERFGSDSVYVCSARVNPKPIQNVIENILGLQNIQVDAVGYHGNGINSTPINALRKKSYIEQLILAHKPRTLYFYDDNMHNIEAVHSLREEEEYAKITSVRCIAVERTSLKLIGY